MARRVRHEEHQNHEAWAIPYGDLITLLLAFFVVMYSISTVNEGKYRAVSDALKAAFQGAPHTVNPVEVGESHAGAGDGRNASMAQNALIVGNNSEIIASVPVSPGKNQNAASSASSMTAMDQVIGKVEQDMKSLVEQRQLIITRHSFGVEIELRTDILFPSGSATLSDSARTVLQQLADTLKPLPYPMRVEGHTDNRPISTLEFPSNWELSAARAASVVHLFMERGIDPARMAVIGLGEYHPKEDNNTEAGRNINRRVVIVILSNGQTAEGLSDSKTADSTAAQSAAVSASETQTTDTPAAH